MPRVTHVKSARKANSVAAVGESYYWWKFRYGGKRYSATYPRPGQLTQSAFYGPVYDLVDQVNNATIENVDDFESFRDEISSAVQDICDECQGSLDNMPESLQESPTGELLQNRVNACESAISEIGGMEAPDEWREIIDQEEERQQWISNEPEPNDFNTTEEFDEVYELWELEEITVDEVEAADLSEMADAVSECMSEG
jgi:hypothetical protein